MKGSELSAVDVTDDWDVFAQMRVDDRETGASPVGAGAYWQPLARNDARLIERNGLSRFRHPRSRVGKAYSDSARIVAHESSHLKRSQLLGNLIQRTPILKSFLDDQIKRTEYWYSHSVNLRGQLAKLSPDVVHLLSSFRLPQNSVLGGCTDSSALGSNPETISHLYLDQLQALDQLCTHHPFTRSIDHLCEVGGGFGVFAHLAVLNFPSLRRLTYVDIFPNLYVAHRYLTAQGLGCVTYRPLKEVPHANPNESRIQIDLMLPETFRRLRPRWTFFYNSNSAVEMSLEAVSAYAEICRSNLMTQRSSAVALRTYRQEKPHSLRLSTKTLHATFDFPVDATRTSWSAPNLFSGTSEYLLIESN
jgi:hypothetical protein